MSPNYILYAEKMLEIRVAHRLGRHLRSQLEELFRFAQECEVSRRLDEAVDQAELPHSEI